MQQKHAEYYEVALQLQNEINENNQKIADFGELDEKLKAQLLEVNKKLKEQLQRTYEEQDKIEPQIQKLKNEQRVLIEQ